MGSKWIHAKLGDYIDSCLGKMLDQNKNTGIYHPYLANNNVRWGYFDLSSLPQMKFEENELKKYEINVGDLIICEGGSEPGRCALWDGEISNMKIQKALHRVRAKNGLKTEYLYYWFNYAWTKGSLDAYFTGTAIKHLTGKAIAQLPIEIPPLHYQENCITLLRSFDEKIKLNNAMNRILENISKSLFKSWFVDFDPVIDNALDAGNPIPEALQSRAELRQKVRNSSDFKPLPADIRALFPAEFEETELGWVPKGWITTSFNDLIELIGGGTPKTSVEEYWNGDIPWFSVVDAPNESDVYVLTTEKNITTEGLNNSSAKLLRKGTTIISARGTVGKCAMVAVPMAMNQSCYGVIGKTNISDEYVYFQLKNAVQTLQQMGHGSVFNTITRDTFKNIKVPFCNEELTNSYSLLVKNYFSKILNNNYQNIALTNLRDTLLPKLISGELSLEDLPNLANQTEPA
ncbi:restriction endonuclease subunit S [Klebsiella grimontii]|uniref:restriction endonuclease subunit S n=1 Tax=Klebsiella grimontii TaxID=2058152 RepID=UPI0012B9010A|nr:restriction endonuclease subunit S [Klebsiella grimontii]